VEYTEAAIRDVESVLVPLRASLAPIVQRAG
jgi:hypothetical protein